MAELRKLAAGAIGGLLLAITFGSTAAVGFSPNVFLVGPPGTPGAGYTSIQAAVDDAQPGDWILIKPGVYHEKGSNDPEHPAGVLIQKPGLHIRGLDRNKVIVDGTNVSATQATGTLPAGSPACSSDPTLQDFGPEAEPDATAMSTSFHLYSVLVRILHFFAPICSFLQFISLFCANSRYRLRHPVR